MGWGLGFCTGGAAAAIAGTTCWDAIASGSRVVSSSTLVFPGSSLAICSSFLWAAGVRTFPLRVTLPLLASTLIGDSFVSGSTAALSSMCFAIWSSLGRREHAMDRASKILNIAIEIGERCELHICSPCVGIVGWRWHLPAAVTSLNRLIFIRVLMPENNRAAWQSKLSFLPVPAGCRLASADRDNSNREVALGFRPCLTDNNASVPKR